MIYSDTALSTSVCREQIINALVMWGPFSEAVGGSVELMWSADGCQYQFSFTRLCYAVVKLLKPKKACLNRSHVLKSSSINLLVYILYMYIAGNFHSDIKAVYDFNVMRLLMLYVTYLIFFVTVENDER